MSTPVSTPRNDKIPVKEYLCVGLALTAALGVVFFKDIYNGINLYVVYFSDAIPFYLFYPGEHFTSKQIADGYFPLWDHLRGMGEPNIVPIGVTMLNPLRLITYLFPGDFGLSLFALARIWLSGMSMYYAGRRFNLGISGASAAALSYMFCGFFMEFISFQDMNAYVFVPMAFGLWRQWTRERTASRFFIMAYVVYILGAAGHPEAIFNYIALYMFFGTLMCFSPELDDGSKKKMVAVWFLTLAWGFVFRFFELFAFTEFWVNGWHHHLADFGRMAHDVKTLPSLIHPFFNLGSLILTNNEIFSRVIPWTPSHIGLITLALASTALLYARRVPFDAIIAAPVFFVAVGMVFGIPVFSELARLPILGESHNHRYLQPMAVFAAALLAGAGLKIVLDDPKGRAATLTALTALALAVCSIIFGARSASISPFMEYKKYFPAIAAYIFIFALFAAGIFLLVAGKKISGRAAPVAIILLLFFDLAVSKHFVGTPGVQRKTLPKTMLSDSPDNWKGTGRIYGAERDVLHPNLAELFGLADFRDQSPLMPKRYAHLIVKINKLFNDREILRHFVTGGYYLYLDLDKIRPTWLDILGIDRVISQTAPSGAQLLWRQMMDADGWETLQPRPGVTGVIPVRVGNTTRRSLVFLSPGIITDNVEIPPGAQYLTVAPSGTKYSPPTCHTLKLGDRASARIVYSRCIGSGEIGWAESQVDVKGYAGEKIAMTLSSAPFAPDERQSSPAAWGDGFINTDKSDPSLELIRLTDFRVYRNNDALPIAFAISGEPPEEPPTDAGEIKDRVRNGAVTKIRNEAQRVSMEVAPEKGDWLVMSRVYFPGWRAFVTGANGKTEERKIVPRMEAFSCMPLEADDREITFVYHPPVFRFLIWTAITGHIFFAVVICAVAARRISFKNKGGA